METHVLTETESRYVQGGSQAKRCILPRQIQRYETASLLPLGLGGGLELQQDSHHVLQGLDLLLQSSGHIGLVVTQLSVEVLAVWHTGLDSNLRTLPDQVAVVVAQTALCLVGSQEGLVKLLGGVVDAQAKGRGGKLKTSVRKQ